MKQKNTFFKLSLLTTAVVSSLAYAQSSQPEQLEMIVVTGNAVPTLITNKQLDMRVASDLKQAMKDQVGMASSAGTGVAQFYSIRGMGEDKINLEVDGSTQSSSVLHHQGRFMLDPALVRVIDVEKGTGAASAGIGALGGVIRVTTVDAKDLLKENQSFGAKIGVTGSSNRGFSTNLAAYIHQNGFDALLAGNFLHNDNYKAGNGEKQYGSKLNQNSYLAKVGYDFNPENSLRFSLRQEYQKGRRLPVIEFAYDPTKENVGESGSAQRQRTFNAEYHGANLGFISQIDANFFRTQVDDYKPPKAGRNIKNESTAMELTTMYSTGGNLNLASQLGDHELKYGFNYRQEKARPSDKSWYVKPTHPDAKNDQQKQEGGVYAEGVWDLSPVTLTTGIRYDKFKYRDGRGQTVSNGQFNPSLGLQYSATPNLTLVAQLNQASRAPRLAETLLINEGFSGFQADKKLKAETARRAELGFRWDSENLKFSGNIFQQNIHDLIVFKKREGFLTNDGKLKMHGYELDATYTLGGLKARVAVSEAKPTIHGSTFVDKAQEDPYYFWNTGRQWLTSLSYRFANPSLELGWTGRYFQKVAFFSTKAKPNHGIKAGYAVHDITLNWQPLGNDVMNVNVGINNLFNKNYRSQSQRGNTGFFERGREFVAGVNYRF